MTLGWIPLIVGFFLLSEAVCPAQPAPSYGVISYRSGGQTFEGYLFRPEGSGPFPAVIFNHGHAKRLRDAGAVSEYFAMARVFVNDGYLFFVPDRHMRYVATNEYSPKLLKLLQQEPKGKAFDQQKSTEVNEINGRDVVAALEWLRTRDDVDRKRIVVSGWSSGAMASLSAVSFDRDVAALVLFSPGVTQWDKPLTKTFLRRGLENFDKPIFIVQGSNDPTSEPSQVAREILGKKTVPFRVEHYPQTGTSGQQHTSSAIQGWKEWGYDVMTFLEKILAQPAAAVDEPG